MASVNPDVLTWANGFLYRTIKTLFDIRGNPEKSSTFLICFGKANGIMQDELVAKRAKFLLKFEIEERQDIEKKFPIYYSTKLITNISQKETMKSC